VSIQTGHGHKFSVAGLLVALGIIYGDIGTSPLYVMKAIIHQGTHSFSVPITEQLIYGGLSCIFWTITLQTTLKYVLLVLKADNNGEGGIFSLFTLVKRRKPFLIWPAIIGGCFLLADGMITPPISVSSAVEGLLILNPNIPTIPIVITIIRNINVTNNLKGWLDFHKNILSPLCLFLSNMEFKRCPNNRNYNE
jgi:KUP system potassium uptake protein